MKMNMTMHNTYARLLPIVSVIKVPPSKTPEAVTEYDVADHELPTFLFIEVIDISNSLTKQRKTNFLPK